MSLTRREWVALELKRRVSGRKGMERVILDRYASIYGRPFVPPTRADEARSLSQRLFDQMLAANRTADTSLAPYADKYRVRDFVTATVGEKHLVPLLWSGVNPLSIPFSSPQLPAILKANHLSDAVIVLTADADRRAVRRRAFAWLLKNHYYVGGEYQYRSIRPRLMVEAMLDDGTPFGPTDYSFWCFQGTPVLVMTRNNSRISHDAFDLNWNLLDVFTTPLREVPLSRPLALQEMTQIARELSAQFPFVRVDLYDVHGHTYVGELTFTPGAGKTRLKDPKLDRLMGAATVGGHGAIEELLGHLQTLRMDRVAVPGQPAGAVAEAAQPGGVGRHP